MRGHIIKRYKDSYTIVLNLGRDPSTGKRKQQWISVKGTKKEAERKLADILHQLDTGTFMKPGKTTVTDFLEQWLNDYQPNLSPRGFERYAGIAKGHLIPALGGIPLTQLRPEHLQKYYTTKLNDGLSAGSVRYHHAVIHVALKTALRWGLIPRNPADAVTPGKPRNKEMQTWDESDIPHFLELREVRETQYYELFYLILFTGMRRSEALALRWSDIDLLLCQVSVNRGLHQLKDGSYIFTEPKSVKSRRMIALPPSAAVVLREYKAKQEALKAVLGVPLREDDLIFAKPGGMPLRPNSVTRAWKTLAARAGLKAIRLHDARHTHASIMLKKGIHPKIVQERLGHSSIQITLDTYSHVAPGLQEAAAARFDEGLAPRQSVEAKKEAVAKSG